MAYALTLVLATLVLRASTLFVSVFNSDEAYIAVQAQVLVRGGKLYLDIADRKPPLVQLLYALVFWMMGRSSIIAVHVLAILVVAATALVVGALARRCFGARSGIDRWAAALYLLASAAYLPAETLAANFELFMMLPVCASLLCVARGRWSMDVLAGVLFGVALLCKQCALFALVPLVHATLQEPRRWRALSLLLVGVALPLALACVTFGAQPLWFWTMAVMPAYASTSGALVQGIWRGVWVSASFIAAHAALAWLVYGARQERSAQVVWLWLAASALSVCAGLRFFGHYYEQLLAPAAILGAFSFTTLAPRRRPRVLAALVVPALLGALVGFWGRAIHRMPAYEDVALYVRAHTTRDERIEVWGHFPEAYWASERMPASRLVHSGFLTGASGGRTEPLVTDEQRALAGTLWQEFFGDLRAHPPRLFLDTSTADLRDYARYPIAHFPALAVWVATYYAPVATIDGITIYQRN